MLWGNTAKQVKEVDLPRINTTLALVSPLMQLALALELTGFACSGPTCSPHNESSLVTMAPSPWTDCGQAAGP